MSTDFYKKGRWPINTNHGWKIRAATKSMEDLYGACPNVVTIGDVEMDQHFFVQESASHPVILGQPYITSSPMETKVFDNGAAFARIKSLDSQRSIQFLTVRANHERNQGSLGGESSDFQSGLLMHGAQIVRAITSPHKKEESVDCEERQRVSHLVAHVNQYYPTRRTSIGYQNSRRY